jgi:hypothetical protein
VTALDIQTGEMTEILSGEIEALFSVSPDGRYLALITDDSGELDFVDRYCIRPDWSGVQDARLAIYDRELGEFVYTTEGFEGHFNEIQWFDDGAILMLGGAEDVETSSNIEGGTSMRQLQFTADGTTLVRTIDENEFAPFSIISVSPDHQQLVVWLTDTYLVDFQSLTKTKIIEGDLPYGINFGWDENNLLQVMLNDGEQIVTYTIRVTPEESP